MTGAYVPDDGPRGARLVLVGEAPANEEVREGRPFVGRSGDRLFGGDGWLPDVGLARADCYVMNVYPYQAPGNDIDRVPAEELEPWINRLAARVSALDDPWVIVPMGATAFRALTGRRGILKHRGYLFSWADQRGRRLKVIPTLHPAATFYERPDWERRCRRDWERIAGDLAFRDLRLPNREHLIEPTLRDIEWFHSQAAKAPRLSIDIETPRSLTLVPQPPTKAGKPRAPKKVYGARRITCVGFAYDPGLSLTIPTTLSYWREPSQLELAWSWIRRLCGLPAEKVLHNGVFDYYWLADYGIWPVNWRWDTIASHHAREPNETHSLAFRASVDVRTQFWKDMKDAKDDDDEAGEPAAEGLRTYWTYNGIDACITRELADVDDAALRRAGMLGFYERHYADLFEPLVALMRTGLCVDTQRQASRYAELVERCAELRVDIKAAAGVDLYGPTGGLSPKKAQEYLYRTLKLPVRTKDGKATAREVAIRQLWIKYPKKLGAIAPLILERARKRKLSEFFRTDVADADGQMRCTYKVTTETGRLASSESPKGTGRNLQNIDREARDVFVPLPGHILLEVDLSQAEARDVYMQSADPVLVELARRPPWEYDVHRENAALIFKVAMDVVTKTQRYLGKKAVHAGHYGMQGQMLADELLKEEDDTGYSQYILTAAECQGMIDAYLDARLGVRGWQAAIRGEVLQNRMLANSWGRMIDFRFDRLDDRLYRRAYAWKPQSNIGDQLNQWGLKVLYQAIRREGWQARILLQLHDALLVSTPPEEAWAIYSLLKSSLEQTRRFPVGGLVIPVEAKVGRRWGCGTCSACRQRPTAGACREVVGFKRPPSREEFEDAIAKLGDA